MRKPALFWSSIARGPRAVVAAVWEFGVDVYSAIRYVDDETPGSSRS